MTRDAYRFLKTKIVCTIGPVSLERSALEKLCQAGMDVARLNMSHSTPEQVRGAAAAIRECADTIGKPVAILLDLQGPKIRIAANIDAPLELREGDRVVLAPVEAARSSELPITYSGLAEDLKDGDRVLLNDGRVELRVRQIASPRVTCEVVIGGSVSGGKGVNLPGVRVSAPALTAKDLADLELALEVEADCIALSFVRSAENVRELKRRVPEDVWVMAKIEKDVALAELEPILEASDAVMVARGDLGTELPFEQVPLVQKRIVRMANSLYRPVVVATEMLESMIERPRPTRAEVSDVANAIFDGTDAVMLSAETAVGRYPVESVRALTRVIKEVESRSAVLVTGPSYDVPAVAGGVGPESTEVAVAYATVEAVRAIQAPAVVTLTRSGYTACVVSSRRPPVPILTVTNSEQVRRQLSLVWGVVPVLCPGEPGFDEMWALARVELRERGLAVPGDRVVVTAGMPFHERGTTNMLRIETV
jgi:pyruvate kinase